MGEKAMQTVGAFEAKTHLAELLDRVGRGETITITRHGVPAARLVPVAAVPGKLSHQDVGDASVALAWCFPDEASEYADAVLTGLAGYEVWVPAVWPLEVANAIAVG